MHTANTEALRLKTGCIRRRLTFKKTFTGFNEFNELVFCPPANITQNVLKQRSKFDRTCTNLIGLIKVEKKWPFKSV